MMKKGKKNIYVTKLYKTILYHIIRYNCYHYPLYDNGFEILLQRQLFLFFIFLFFHFYFFIFLFLSFFIFPFFENVPDIIKSPLSSLLICPTQATGQLQTNDTDKRQAVLELLIFDTKKL